MTNNEDFKDLENEIKKLKKPNLDSHTKAKILQELEAGEKPNQPEAIELPRRKPIYVAIASIVAVVLFSILGYSFLNNDNFSNQVGDIHQGADQNDQAEIGHSADQNEQCDNMIIDYIDALVINGITYEHLYDVDASLVNNGKELGKTQYMLNGNACPGYEMKDFDATYLSVGTSIYEAAGYDSSFRVIANNKLYEATNSPEAAKVSDLFPIENLVEKISIVSTEDGSHIKDFSGKGTKEFIEEFLKLDYVGQGEIHNQSLNEGKRIFLQFHYKDGTTSRILYWQEHNAFHFGAIGTEKMKEIVQYEVRNRSRTLKLNEQTFDPELIEFYTGIPSKFESYTIEEVKNDVYVHGVITHSGTQSIVIYSKIDKNKTQTIEAILENNILKIYVKEELTESKNERKEHVVFYTSFTEQPKTFQVYRNGSLESTKELGYGIE
jgi:hypothetical protein